MSWVAEANAVIQKIPSVTKNRGADENAVPGPCGSRKGRRNMVNDMSTCMAIIHQRLFFIRSMNGLHKGFITHGRYRRLVYSDIWPLGMPMSVNMTTDMVFTRKYGMPSAKYSVGTQIHGFLVCFIAYCL